MHVYMYVYMYDICMIYSCCHHSLTALSEVLSGDSSSISTALREIKSVSVGVVCLEFKGDNVFPQNLHEIYKVHVHVCMNMYMYKAMAIIP